MTEGRPDKADIARKTREGGWWRLGSTGKDDNSGGDVDEDEGRGLGLSVGRASGT